MPIKADCEPPRSECCYSGYLCLRDGGVASLPDGKSKVPVLKADFAWGFRPYGKAVRRHHDRADLVAASIDSKELFAGVLARSGGSGKSTDVTLKQINEELALVPICRGVAKDMKGI